MYEGMSECKPILDKLNVKILHMAYNELPDNDATTENVDENIACKVCWQRPFNVVCLPCTHLVMCKSCLKNVEKCVTCREDILAYVSIFIS
jgi:hypothetical protein